MSKTGRYGRERAQMTAGWDRTRGAAVRTEPQWYTRDFEYDQSCMKHFCYSCVTMVEYENGSKRKGVMTNDGNAQQL